jgi:rhamnose transport system permease protein
MTGDTVLAPTVQDAAAPRPRWQVLLIRPETMTFVLLVIAVFVASLLSPFFLDINYILRSFTLSAEFAIVALVLTMVIIAGEIDLSPAANMALSACLFAYAQQAGIPMPIAIAIGLAAGVLMGAINALMVIALQLPSIIVTIGTLTLYRGLAQVIAGDKSMVHRHQYAVRVRHPGAGGDLHRHRHRSRRRARCDDFRAADLSDRHK